ncbi:MAG: ABC transporter ATP-binding protein [Beijerinckiaceae bacterium]
MASAHPLLEIENLRIGFEGHEHLNEVVKGVSFRVPAGKTVALVGESGSGKSVISQAIMGILPRKGRIMGGAIRFRDPKQPDKVIDIAAEDRDGPVMLSLRGGRIGMIFQEPMSSLSPVHRVGDQIAEALCLHRDVKSGEDRAVVVDMLRLVGFRDPDKAYDLYSFQLSGGLRQRAMLAMALVCRPALLIADEPTTALDVTVQAQVLKIMRNLQAEIGMAMLLITHDLGVVANVADEVVVIYHGEIMEMGSREDIFRRPEHPYLKALLKALPHTDMKPGERLTPLREVEKAKSAPAAVPLRQTNPLVSVRHLSKTYGGARSWFGGEKSAGVRAVHDMSFDIRRGECLGLVGESGSGKTSVSKVLLRAISADAGEVIFDDGKTSFNVLKLPHGKLNAFRRSVQMIFQDPVSSLSPRLTVRDILREPLDIHQVGTDAERDARVAGLMQDVGLDPRFLNRYPHSFSGGQRQRIGIARALALSPDLVVCDEPVSALDVSVQAQVLNLLKDLQRERGLTYLFISHNLAVVKYMADRIAVMANGRIVEIAPTEILMKAPRHPYTQLLLSAVPQADLDRPLDLDSLPLHRASDMSHWPSAFQDGGDPASLALVTVGEGHLILARPQAPAMELAA